MPRQRTIFVSCGQLSEDEKALGHQLTATIERHGMNAFFAEDVHSTGALNTVIFKAIHECDAFLAVLQKRGTVTYKDYPPSQRSSVWIQQEIAVLSYRMYLEQRSLPIRVYSERGIRREGVMEVAIVNAIEVDSPDEIVADVDKWLGGREFEEHPVVARREELFNRRLAALTEDHMLMLELVAAHSFGPDHPASWDDVRNDFYDILRGSSVAEREIERRFNDALATVRGFGLVSDGPKPPTNQLVMWLARQWWHNIHDALRARGRRV
jgi:hypothetical protein